MDIDLNKSIENNGLDEGISNLKGDNDGLGEAEEDLIFGDDSIALQLEKMFEVGNLLESQDQVYLLYCEYGRCCGFSVRKGDQAYFHGSNMLRMKEYDCSCEGRHDDKRSKLRLAAYKKQVTRTGCKAGIRIVRERDGPWKVQKFIKEHNHEMLPEDQRYMLRTARQLSHAQKSLVEALNSAGIGVSRACRFLEKEAGGPENVGFMRRDAYNHLNRVKLSTSVDSVDANALVQYFAKKANEDPLFFWDSQTDDDGRLMNFFFRDSRSLIDYEYFGDVLSVDTTYKTNRYKLVCAPFVGINHHMRNVLFGLAFLSNEDTASFEWMFATFLQSMYGKEPQVIFTDQSQPLMNAIDLSFQTASHRLCQWHIARNAPSHFGVLNTNSEFRKTWYYCMNGVETEDEFQKCWDDMVKKFDLAKIKWFSTMYKLRKRWATVFTNTSFSAGLLATSRSEATNKVLKDLCNARCSLTEIVQKFDQIQSDWRRKEREDDASNVGTAGQFVNNSLLLSQCSKVYTRNVYKMFEAQLALAVAVAVIGHPMYIDEDEMEFRVASQPLMRRIRTVYFNRVSHEAACSCRMWESEGVLCRHIFRVYMAMNVVKFPERYILNRWTRKAKERHVNQDVHFFNYRRGGVEGGMSFVNHMTRMVMELAYCVLDKPEAREIMVNRIAVLKNELTGAEKNVQPPSRGKKWNDVRPPRSRKRGKSPSPNLQSHWAKKKGKGPKRPVNLPRWPDVELSQQSESTMEKTIGSRRMSPSNSNIKQDEGVNSAWNETIFKQDEGENSAWKLCCNETYNRSSPNENLDSPIDVTPIFQSQEGENVGPRVWV